MWHVVKIFSFAWAYLRPYRTRLFLGFLASFIYAGSNGGFVWLTRAFTERFKPRDTESAAGVVVTNLSVTTISVTNDSVANVPVTNISVAHYSTTNNAAVNDSPSRVKPKLELNSRLTEWVKQQGEALKTSADPWLPRVGEPIAWRHVVTLLLILPLLAVVRGLADYGSNYCLAWASARAVRDLRLAVMEKLASLSLDYFSQAKTGDVLTRVNTDTQNLARSFASGAPDLIKEAATLITIFVVLWKMDWQLTVAALTVLPVCAAPLLVLGKKARKATRAGRNIAVLQTSQLVEFISGIRVLKAFNLERAEIERFRAKSGELVRTGMKGVQAKESVGPVIGVITALGLGLLLLYVFSAQHDAGKLLTFVVGFLLTFQSIRKLAAVHMLYEMTHVSVDRLADIMDESPKVSDPPAPQPLAEFKSAITFEGVGFGYREAPVLSDVDIKIPCGFKLGIAGQSGSGKTTLVNLLFRFYDPTRGTVRIDGQDLRTISVRDLRQQMALVSQDIVLFDQTIAENIGCGKANPTRAEIEQAARSAFAHDFIMQLPQGYDTNVGERGTTLSGGQRQRVCIARAFVRDAPILVLDEATGSLDSTIEAEVQAAIDRLAEHRTVVCIAHRLSTLADMDRIIVLNEGRIVESGTFQELLARAGIFAGMAANQGIFPAGKGAQ